MNLLHQHKVVMQLQLKGKLLRLCVWTNAFAETIHSTYKAQIVINKAGYDVGVGGHAN